ncbi:MAG: hypothetical protein K5683_10410, partial [Prevotella sp.]|nr:hypothetical protein [Prevotella sp.]
MSFITSACFLFPTISQQIQALYAVRTTVPKWDSGLCPSLETPMSSFIIELCGNVLTLGFGEGVAGDF